jgi:hypothetical protein
MYLAHIPATCPPISFFFIWSLNNIWWGQTINLFFIRCSPLLCYLAHLKPEYLHQNSVLEHSDYVPSTWETKLSFTPVQKLRHNYIYAYFNLYIFG